MRRRAPLSIAMRRGADHLRDLACAAIAVACVYLFGVLHDDTEDIE